MMAKNIKYEIQERKQGDKFNEAINCTVEYFSTLSLPSPSMTDAIIRRSFIRIYDEIYGHRDAEILEQIAKLEAGIGILNDHEIKHRGEMLEVIRDIRKYLADKKAETIEISLDGPEVSYVGFDPE